MLALKCTSVCAIYILFEKKKKKKNLNAPVKHKQLHNTRSRSKRSLMHYKNLFGFVTILEYMLILAVATEEILIGAKRKG